MTGASRRAELGDELTGLVVMNRDGRTVWAGEFVATYGSGKLGEFARGCQLDQLSWMVGILADRTIVLIDPREATAR